MELETFQFADVRDQTNLFQQCVEDFGAGMKSSMQNGWVRKPLGDIADVISGYAFKSNEFGDQGIPVIKIKNIRVGTVDISDADRVDEKYLDIPERYHVRGGDILISLTGSHISQPNSVVGRVARHSTCLPTCLLNQRAGKVMVRDRSTCDLCFLFYALSEPEAMRAIAMLAHGAASQANVSPSQVESIEIPFPPLPMQRRIAGILSAYDELIENSQRRIRILEEMARVLYREWFVHFRFPGHENHPLVPSSLGDIPQGWEVKSIYHFGSVITGKTPSKANADFYGKDVPFVKTPDMHGNMFILSTIDSLSMMGADSQANKTLPAGSICVSCIGTIGVVSITTEDCQTNQQINSVILTNPVSREFLFFRLQDVKQALENLGANGATMGNVNKGKFEAMEIICPFEDILTRYHQIVTPMFSETLSLYRKVQNLRRMRDILLPRLLSGDIDTST